MKSIEQAIADVKVARDYLEECRIASLRAKDTLEEALARYRIALSALHEATGLHWSELSAIEPGDVR